MLKKIAFLLLVFLPAFAYSQTIYSFQHWADGGQFDKRIYLPHDSTNGTSDIIFIGGSIFGLGTDGHYHNISGGGTSGPTTVPWDSVTDKPNISAVGLTGQWLDILNKPTLIQNFATNAVHNDTTYNYPSWIMKLAWATLYQAPDSNTYGYHTLGYYWGLFGVRAQADWTQSDNTQPDYILHKPTLGTAAALDVPATGNASSTQVVLGSDTRLGAGGSGGSDSNSAYYRQASVVNVATGMLKRNLVWTQLGTSITEIEHIFEQNMKVNELGPRIGLEGVGFVAPNLDVYGPYNMSTSTLAGSGFVDSVTTESLNGFARWGDASSTPMTYQVLTAASSPYGDANFSQITVYYLQQPGGGSFTLTHNGTGHTVSTAGTKSIQSYVLSGITDTVATQEFTYGVTTTGTVGVMLEGFSLDRPGVLGAKVNRVGHSGWKAIDYMNLNPTIFHDMLVAIGGDVVTIELGTNEQFVPYDTAAYRVLVDSFYLRVKAALPNCTVIFTGQHSPSHTNRKWGATPYNNELKALADKYNAAFLNDSTIYGTFDDMSRAGDIQVDSIHQTYQGGRKYTDALVALFPSFAQTLPLPYFYTPIHMQVGTYAPLLYNNNNMLLMSQLGIDGIDISATIHTLDTLDMTGGSDIELDFHPASHVVHLRNDGGNGHIEQDFGGDVYADHSGVGLYLHGLHDTISGAADTPDVHIGTPSPRVGITIGKGVDPNGRYLDIGNHDNLGYDLPMYIQADARNPGIIDGGHAHLHILRSYVGLFGNYFGNTPAWEMSVNDDYKEIVRFDTGHYANDGSQTKDLELRSKHEGGDVDVVNAILWGRDGNLTMGITDSSHHNYKIWVEGGISTDTFNLRAPDSVDVPTGGFLFRDAASGTVKVTPAPAGTGNNYTPSLSNTLNITTSSLINATWTKNGNIVHVKISANVTPTALGMPTGLSVALPATEGTMTGVYVGFGVQIGTPVVSGYTILSGTTGATSAEFSWLANSTSSVQVIFDIDYSL